MFESIKSFSIMHDTKPIIANHFLVVPIIIESTEK